MEFEKLIASIESICADAQKLAREVDDQVEFTTRPYSTHASCAAHDAIWDVYEALEVAKLVAKKNLWFTANWTMIAKDKPPVVSHVEPDVDPFR